MLPGAPSLSSVPFDVESETEPAGPPESPPPEELPPPQATSDNKMESKHTVVNFDMLIGLFILIGIGKRSPG
ncbi:MAG: hypothetical protein U5R46_05770 [Gammaproteobacteria bacterium]|nr:hypothetical protein [Gammaproteobacteria bacterium]